MPAKGIPIDRRNNLKDWAGYELSLLYPLREDYIFFKEIPARCYVANGTIMIGFGPILMIANNKPNLTSCANTVEDVIINTATIAKTLWNFIILYSLYIIFLSLVVFRVVFVGYSQ